MEQEPKGCRRKPYRPWVSGHLMPKRHVKNDRKRPLLSDQSVVLPPKIAFTFTERRYILKHLKW